MSAIKNSIFIILILIVLYYFCVHLLRNRYNNKLVQLLKDKNYKEFDKLSKTIIVKYVFQPYNLEYLRLNRFLLEGKNDNKVDQQFSLLIQKAKGDFQKKDILLKAFEYYTFHKNKEKSRTLLTEIEKVCDTQQINDSNLLYDVLILEKNNHIDDLKSKIQKENNANQAIYYELLIIQYTRLQDKSQVDYYKNELQKLSH